MLTRLYVAFVLLVVTAATAYPNRFLQKTTRQDAVLPNIFGDAPLRTNAKRFAAGLPPLPPNRLYSPPASRSGPHVARQSASSPVNGKLAVRDSNGNPVFVAYIASQNSATWNPDHGVTVYPLPDVPQTWSLESQVEPSEHLQDGNGNYAKVSIAGDINGGQTKIWNIDATTGRLSVTWQNNDDGTTFSTSDFYLWFPTGSDPSQNGGFIVTGDIEETIAMLPPGWSAQTEPLGIYIDPL
ncbi:hypothetical protein FRB99_006549 [Tulasnella sp. 403]|nr:hypothetical protein FRB99_006549 [Tulasnella sp. 403]